MLRIVHLYPPGNSLLRRYVEMLCRCDAGGMVIQHTDSLQTLRDWCRQSPPDIIHLHGSAARSLPRCSRLVVTPHGSEVAARLLRRAFVTVARSAVEQRRLQSCASRIWVVRNPIITKTTTPQECVSRMVHLYQTVMHTDPLPLLSPASRQALSMLLRVGITGDVRWAGGAASQGRRAPAARLCAP